MQKHALTSLAFLAATTFASGQGLLFTSLEQFNRQTSASVVTAYDYVAFATVENLPSVTGATFSINGGTATTMPLDGDLYELRTSYANPSALTAAYPANVGYSFVLSGTPAGTVNVNSPTGTFANNLPITPLFTLAGVSGTWSVQNNVGVFSFNPSGVTSFTISLNAYNASNKGGHYGSFIGVADIQNGFTEIDDAGIGPIADSVTPAAITATFTPGLAANSDGSDLTYGFVSGSRYEIEGGLFNIFNLATADGAVGGTGAQEGFIYGQTTSFILHAIPEPATYAQLLGGLAILCAVVQRRRRSR